MSSDEITGAIDAASQNAQASVRASKDEAAVATSKAIHAGQDAVHQASSAGGDVYGRAKEHVQGLADRLPDTAADAYRTGQRMYAQGSEQVGRHVAKQPFEALLLAGAIGYLVGWASSRS